MSEYVAMDDVIIQVEAQLDMKRKEMQGYISRRTAEAKKMADEIELEFQNISTVEKEAAELLQVMPTT